MILPLTADIRYLHQLAWRPAQFAHPLWLAAAGMNTASYHYGRSVVMDRALNTRLNRLRHFPQQPLPAVLSQQQQYQIVKPERLSARCLALGLVYLQCDDYLRLRRYRQQLSPLLSESDIQQLMGMGYRGHLPARLSPAQLLTTALRLGKALLTTSVVTVWYGGHCVSRYRLYRDHFLCPKRYPCQLMVG
uniref:Uncharacterized protein n=1 Tax=Yersinia enterocolitica W22703 TaxID=913028 RepID=F4N3C3_YEREN|nr:hypothetical protein YEW_HJ33410 [Yersinia enterocolitica W22703]